MSKTASAKGRLSLARFAYRPVSGDRKSGIPAEVLIPAPTYGVALRPSHNSNEKKEERLTMTTIFFARPSLINLATESSDLSFSFCGGVFLSTTADCS